MALKIPYKEPVNITQGTTVSWNKKLDNFKASDGWVLTYYFRGPSSFQIVATANGDEWSIVANATVTSAYEAGDYELFGKVSLNDDAYVVYSGHCCLLIDPVNIKAGEDRRSYNQKMVDKIQEALLGSSQGGTVTKVKIGDREYETRADLEILLTFFEKRLVIENNRKKKAMGLPTGELIQFSF